MIYPPELHRAEAIASRIWQLVLEAREFRSSVKAALEGRARAAEKIRILTEQGEDPFSHPFQLEVARRCNQTQTVRSLFSRQDEIGRLVRQDVRSAHDASKDLPRGEAEETRRELAAALWAARAVPSLGLPGDAEELLSQRDTTPSVCRLSCARRQRRRRCPPSASSAPSRLRKRQCASWRPFAPAEAH